MKINKATFIAILSACAVSYGVDIKSGGNYIGTQAMWAITPAQKFQGPRLKDLTVTTSSYGNQIPLLFAVVLYFIFMVTT